MSHSAGHVRGSFFQLVNIPLGLPSNHFRYASLSFMVSLNNYVCPRKQIKKKKKLSFPSMKTGESNPFRTKIQSRRVAGDSLVISQMLCIMSLAV